MTFNLREPAAYLLNKITSPWHVVLPAELVTDPSLIDWTAVSRGSGPYHLPEPGRLTWRLERNPEYFKRDPRSGQPLPYLDGLRGAYFDALAFEPPDSPHAQPPRLEQWASGDLHAVAAPTPSSVEAALELQPEAVVLVTPPAASGAHFSFSYAALFDGPFIDPRVRAALSMALNRNAYAAQYFEGFTAPDCGQNWSFVVDPASASGFREWPWSEAELHPQQRFDPNGARALLAAAGYSHEQPLAFALDLPPTTPPPGATRVIESDIEHVSHWLRRQLETELGDAVQIVGRPRSWEVRRETINAGGDVPIQVRRTYELVDPDADLVFEHGGAPSYAADADNLAYARMHSSRGWLNRYGIDDPQIDEWAEAQRRAVDAHDRSVLLERIRQREGEQTWRLFLAAPYQIRIRQPNVFNLVGAYFAAGLQDLPTTLERTWLAPPNPSS